MVLIFILLLTVITWLKHLESNDRIFLSMEIKIEMNFIYGQDYIVYYQLFNNKETNVSLPSGELIQSPRTRHKCIVKTQK